MIKCVGVLNGLLRVWNRSIIHMSFFCFFFFSSAGTAHQCRGLLQVSATATPRRPARRNGGGELSYCHKDRSEGTLSSSITWWWFAPLKAGYKTDVIRKIVKSYTICVLHLLIIGYDELFYRMMTCFDYWIEVSRQSRNKRKKERKKERIKERKKRK